MSSKQLFFCLIAGALLPIAQPTFAQSGPPLWKPTTAPTPKEAPGRPEPASWFVLDTAQLAGRLALAPPETRPAEAVLLELPFPDGTLHRFAITQVPVMAPALAARYPQIRTYAGQEPGNPGTSVRLETTPAGLHAQVLTPAGPLSILVTSRAASRYQSHQDAPPDFTCETPSPLSRGPQARGGTPPAAPAPYGAQRRTLRLALAATGEYTQKLGGGTVAGTLATMVSLVSSLNAVYERELALRLELVANNDLLIFSDPNTDPYDNSSPTTLLNANIAALNAALPGGATTYDLGHVLGHLSTGGYSGIAGVGVVCSASAGRGASTASSTGLMAAVVTHEIGHQLGSGHTFNGDKGNCGGGNRSSQLAYEPGAGNTIMSYSRRCDPDNVGDGIDYFHAGSLSAIVSRLTCGVLTPTGNQPPSVTVPPSTYTIPQGTPFALVGTGTDPNGDALTYSWEQLDQGNASGLSGAATDASGPPLFRSFAPGASPTRTFPNLTSVRTNTEALGEILPLVARTLNFRLTARDGRGGVAAANVALAVGAGGPFRVTAPAAAVSAPVGGSYTVTWDVQGTDQPPVGCAAVQILFSTDDGLTFPTVLLNSTPNDGTAQVTLPNVSTTRGRLKIQAINNVFFALNTGSITLTGTPLPVELTAFSAEVRGTTAHLAWTTASEKNNAGFAVEASADGASFRRLGWVAGQGSSTQASSYQFDDATLAANPGPTVYYRLRQADKDGTESFSPVRSVAIPANKTAQLQVWPNPARGSATVTGLAAGQRVQLLDLTGRVRASAEQPENGALRLVLPGDLTPGIYVVHAGGQSRRLVVE